jgi:hypothetical protein
MKDSLVEAEVVVLLARLVNAVDDILRVLLNSLSVAIVSFTQITPRRVRVRAHTS